MQSFPTISPEHLELIKIALKSFGIIVAGVLMLIYRESIRRLGTTLLDEIKKGGSLTFGKIFTITGAKSNPDVKKERAESQAATTLNMLHSKLLQKHKGIFLTHVFVPSGSLQHKCDVFVYLYRHHTADLSQIKYAEFSFGDEWGNPMIVQPHPTKPLGVAVKASDPFLCYCRVTFHSGLFIDIHRSIDLEMRQTYPTPQDDWAI